MHFRRSRCEPLQVLASIASVGEASGFPFWEFRQSCQVRNTEIIAASTGLGQLNHAWNGVGSTGCCLSVVHRGLELGHSQTRRTSHTHITSLGSEPELKNSWGPSSR
jgi:hypothetical protein